MNVEIENSWKSALQSEFSASYFTELVGFVKSEYTSHECYPRGSEIFNALNLCPLDQVKVVILGQDPYINPNQAHGLCFSVKEGVSFPPSLRNIFKELNSDLGVENASGNLTTWAEQGVLLLNSTLTVRAGESNSHEGKGWGKFTSAVIRELNARKQEVVYMLWGNFAKKKAAAVDASKNLILTSVHPSPLSAHRGFFGCKHFSQANDYLTSKSKIPINWQL